MAFTPDELATATEWNKIIKTNVSNALGSKLDGEFIAVNYPAGFPYAVKQQYYNADALSVLNLLLTEADGIPAFGSPFSSLFLDVINNLEYAFSTSDQALMNQEETAQASLVGTIINEYKQSELDDTPQDYPGILYIIKRIKEVTGTDYKNVNFEEYPTLSALCRNLNEYARLGKYTAKMESAWNIADDKMRAITEHITNPSIENGGIKTDANTVSIGWLQLPETGTLLHDLQSGSTISFSFSARDFHDESSTLYFTSGVTAHIPFSWLFDLHVEHEHEYDLSKYARNESKLSFTITYKGVTTLSAIPATLSDSKQTGWFAGDILNAAALNSGKDATGYKLHGSQYNPATLFGENGQLKRMKTFVLSQQPEITLSFSKFDCSAMQQIFTQSTDVTFSILGGLISGEHNNDYSFTEYSYNEQEQTLTVKIVPTPIGSVGSIGKQTAFVLGGVAEYYSAP